MGGANPAAQTLMIQREGGGTIDWAASGNAPWLLLSYTGDGGSQGLKVSVAASGLSPGTYQAQLAVSSEGASNSPIQVGVTLTVTGVPPASPAGLKASVSFSPAPRVELIWNDVSGDEYGFRVERKQENGSYAQIGTAGAGNTSYTDTGVHQEIIYYYRVSSYNAVGNSQPSSEAVAAILAAPSNLEASLLSSSQVRLRWSDSSSLESGYEIERKIGLNGNYERAGTAGAGADYLVDSSSFSAGNIYYYRIRAFRTDGYSAYAETQVSVPGGNVSIWPGDLDNDGEADVYDVLAVGAYWNLSGPARQIASTEWSAQPCQAWVPQAAVFADADGNGLVDEDDFQVLVQNYGKTRFLAGAMLNLAGLAFILLGAFLGFPGDRRGRFSPPGA
jgi:hypothetical protein